MPRFQGLFRGAGVDEEAEPVSMIVPLHGDNLVVLEDGLNRDGWAIVSDNKIAVQHSPISNLDLVLKTRIAVYNFLQVGTGDQLVDTMNRKMFEPHMYQTGQYLDIHGAALTGSGGTLVHARLRNREETKMKVVVVAPQTIKIAIRHLVVSNENGTLGRHAVHPVDLTKVLERMNLCWRPQTNIEFSLISSADAIIDDSKPEVRKRIARLIGLTASEAKIAHPDVFVSKLAPMFAEVKDFNADITMFVVESIVHSEPKTPHSLERPNGVTMSDEGRTIVGAAKGFCVVAANKYGISTFAHEAGHFVGKMDHVSAQNWAPLMQDGGGWTIDFNTAMKFRKFKANKQGGGY